MTSLGGSGREREEKKTGREMLKGKEEMEEREDWEGVEETGGGSIDEGANGCTRGSVWWGKGYRKRERKEREGEDQEEERRKKRVKQRRAEGGGKNGR